MVQQTRTRPQQEENVNVHSQPGRRVAVIAAALGLMLSACSANGGATTGPTNAAPTTGATTSSAASLAPCGTVKLAVNPWVGYEADAAVVAYVLEHSLGCTVVVKNIDEQTSWQGFPTGEVDAILENWGHDDLVAKYITADKTAQDLGPTGNEGVIGWYVPKFFADAHPEILTAKTDPKVLNSLAALFKTSESGDKGQVLDGDPSFVTNDQGMINAFGLNYKVVYSGSEAASNKAIQTAIDQQKPILAYYYTPNWFSAKVDLVHIEFPAYTTGCDADPSKIACDYPPYHLNKIVSTKFATSGSPAYTLIKNFKWTNEDQNAVAADITDAGMSDADAAKKWLDAHTSTWMAWLP